MLNFQFVKLGHKIPQNIAATCFNLGLALPQLIIAGVLAPCRLLPHIVHLTGSLAGLVMYTYTHSS